MLQNKKKTIKNRDGLCCQNKKSSDFTDHHDFLFGGDSAVKSSSRSLLFSKARWTR